MPGSVNKVGECMSLNPLNLLSKSSHYMAFQYEMPSPCFVHNEVYVNLQNGSFVCREVTEESFKTDEPVFTGDIIVVFNPSSTTPHSIKLSGRKIQEFLLKTA